MTKCRNQKLTELKEETDKSIILFGNINTPLSVMDRTSKQKISKDMEELNSTVNPVGPNRYIQITPTIAEYILS